MNIIVPSVFGKVAQIQVETRRLIALPTGSSFSTCLRQSFSAIS